MVFMLAKSTLIKGMNTMGSSESGATVVESFLPEHLVMILKGMDELKLRFRPLPDRFELHYIKPT